MLLGPSGVAWNKASCKTSQPEAEEARSGDGDEIGEGGKRRVLRKKKRSERMRKYWKDRKDESGEVEDVRE